MRDTEYKLKLQQAFMVARFVLTLEGLPELIEQMNHAESIGCYLDPTLWMRGVDALGQHKAIVSALLRAQQELVPARNALARIVEQQLSSTEKTY